MSEIHKIHEGSPPPESDYFVSDRDGNLVGWLVPVEMTESTLYREPGCVIHSVPGIDAITEAEACVKCGAERRWVVPVEPCEHGNYAEHLIDEYAQDYCHISLGRWCPGAKIGGDE